MKEQAKVLVTGASGFIGSLLVKALFEQGYSVVGVGRKPPGAEIKTFFSEFICCDLTQIEFDPSLLKGVTAVVNLAGLAHNAKKGDKDFESAYLASNALMPERLARASVEANVSKFIHLSSVKAVGEVSGPGTPFDESTDYSLPPKGVYGRSKWEGERRLNTTLANSKIQLIILRPPLVYGPNAKGTLLQLVRLIDRGFPLPLKLSQAKRSFISVSNMCSAIMASLQGNNKISGTYFVSDGPSILVPQLIEIIAKELGITCSLFPCPTNLIKALASISGKSDIYQKLFLNLEIKSDKFRNDFSWTPPHNFQEGIREMIFCYKSSVLH